MRAALQAALLHGRRHQLRLRSPPSSCSTPTEEQGHADQIAARIMQLQGEPDFNPTALIARSHAEYVEGTDLVDMIKEDLVAERVAIDSYSEIIRWLGDDDITTRRLMEQILAVEEEHADDLLTFLKQFGVDL